MADMRFIALAIDGVLAVLQQYTPALLQMRGRTPIAEWGRSFSGIVINPPKVSVMPRTTDFDPEGSGRHQEHKLTVKLSVVHPEEEELMNQAIDYMWAIDQAIQAAQEDGEWDVRILRVFVSQHNYGALYERGNMLARFPEMYVVVETMEVQ